MSESCCSAVLLTVANLNILTYCPTPSIKYIIGTLHKRLQLAKAQQCQLNVGKTTLTMLIHAHFLSVEVQIGLFHWNTSQTTVLVEKNFLKSLCPDSNNMPIVTATGCENIQLLRRKRRRNDTSLCNRNMADISIYTAPGYSYSVWVLI